MSPSPLFSRRLVAACSAAAPVLLLVAFLIGPSMAAGTGHPLASVAAHRDAVVAQSALLLVSTILFVPIFFGVVPLLAERGRRLARTAAAVFLLGFAGHAGIAFVRIALVQMSRDHDQAAMMQMADHLEHGVLTALTPLLLAFDVALILLFAALYRARLAPAWVFGTMLAAVVATGVLGNGKASFVVAAALGTVAGVWMSRTFLRTSDHAWATGGAALSGSPA